MDKKDNRQIKIIKKKGGCFKMSVLATPNKNLIILDSLKFQTFISSNKNKQLKSVLKKSKKIRKQIERTDT